MKAKRPQLGIFPGCTDQSMPILDLAREFESHGLPANRRAQVVEEGVLVMKQLWTQEIAEFHGEHFDLAAS